MYTMLKVVVATVAASFVIAHYPAQTIECSLYLVKGATYIESNVSSLMSSAVVRAESSK